MSADRIPGHAKKGSGRKIVPWCVVCGQVPDGGICGGMKINRIFLCSECENLLMTTPVGSEHYLRIMEGMRGLYQCAAMANRCLKNE